jgi:hypothetical protein
MPLAVDVHKRRAGYDFTGCVGLTRNTIQEQTMLEPA